jgi:hypothetical protein
MIDPEQLQPDTSLPVEESDVHADVGAEHPPAVRAYSK